MALGFGFNKAKVLASAEKFVQQGKLQNAISEYEKVAKEDPKDQTVLNTVGDLYARLGQNEHAAMYFKKVGDQYAQNGFTVKAIAIYKKLGKLQPNDSENATKLAELYAQQGLLNDARSQYMHVAEACLRSGENNQAARIFQRILELDPENAHTQAKLADLYVKIGKRDEARNIYQTAAQALYARESYEAAGEALDKALSLDPGNKEATLLRGMIAAGSGDHSNAIRHLERAAETDAKSDVLHALLEAKLKTGEVSGADEIAIKLLDVHKDISGIRTLAEWYTNNDHLSSAVRLYERYSDQLFPQGSSAARDTLYPLLNRVQGDPQLLKTITRLLDGSGEIAQTAEMMETQAHACAQKGDFVQARDLYKKLMELEPENALHGQNYKQMLAKLGEDSATRILSPEEAAQAFMVEELVDNAPPVQQKYDPPTESAIEAALTDAELFVSYNVPSKAIPPLEAALPLAPKDVNLNQRLASLYARAERWGDAARMCQNLSEIYRELGHPNEAARYQEAARKYQLRAPQTTQRQPVSQPKISVSPQAEGAVISPHLEPAAEPSIKEFSFDIPEPAPAMAEAEPAPASVAPIEMEVAAGTPEITVTPARSASHEIDLSNEWENMLTVEPAAEAPVAAEHDTQPIIVEPPLTQPEPVAVITEPEGGSAVCYLPTEKVEEVQFYIAQGMWPAAKKALLELTEIAPDAPEINELMAAVAAGQRKSSKSGEVAPAASFAAAMEPASAAVDFLPPPFAAPAPHPTSFSDVLPSPAPPPVAAAAHQEQILDLPVEISHSAPPAHASASVAATAHTTTEDILGDFLVDLEKGDLADFAPKPKAEVTVPASAPAPVHPPAKTHAAAAGANGSAKEALRDAESSSVLNDIFSDLQEENTATTEAEEDPETHYNLGIAFKEMGLLDEAIGELQKVCRAVDHGQKFSQPIQAYTWLAQCLVDKGAPEASLRWYNKALQLPGLDDSSRNAIYYDLAAACEASGDKKSALANFMEVYGSNIDFRDVASRIKELKS